MSIKAVNCKGEETGRAYGKAWVILPRQFEEIDLLGNLHIDERIVLI